MSSIRIAAFINAALAAITLSACGGDPNAPINPADTATGPPPGNQGTWSVASSMPIGVSEFGATVYRDRIYVAGGLQIGDNVSDRVYRFDPATENWERLADLPEPRFAMPLVAVGDTLYGVGGLLREGFHESSLWAYLADQDQWEARADLPDPIIKGGAAALNGEVVLAGGSNGLDPVFDLADSMLIYDPTTVTWRRATQLLTPRTALSVVSAGGMLYATAGITPVGGLATTEVFDANVEEWSSLPDAFTARLETAASVLRGRIHVLGGFDRGFMTLARHEAYDPATGTWAAYPDLPVARSAPAAVTFNDKIYVMGGEVSSGSVSDRVDVFELN